MFIKPVSESCVWVGAVNKMSHNLEIINGASVMGFLLRIISIMFFMLASFDSSYILE